MNKSVKKVLIWTLVVAFVVGSIIAGGPFNLIDIIIVRPIVNILFVIFNLVSYWGWDFGAAIILFTVLVKFCMWPLTKAQLNQTKLMRRIQPELTQIRKNCNGNKQMESLQTMDLYKRYNVKPFASILVLLVQLPIFIAIFSAIRVVATPTVADNLDNRAYSIVAYEGSAIADLEAEQQLYLADLQNDEIPADEKHEYDFHPTLFRIINLDARASEVLTWIGAALGHVFNPSTVAEPGAFSWSALFMLAIAVAAALAQYFMTRQQMSSGKSEKKKKFRELLKEANEGKEIDQSEINNITTGQMSKMMPLMMFIIMISLHGALAFYYFLSNVITIVQQKIVFSKAREEMDNATDKAMTRELKKIQEAEVVENKKTGTKVTRISTKDVKRSAKKSAKATKATTKSRVAKSSKKEKK